MDRRQFCRGSLALSAAFLSGTAAHAGRRTSKPKEGHKHFIFVNLHGAPSQLELFDPKPGTLNGGPTQAINTAIPGVRFAETLPGLADLTPNAAVLRMTSRDANHQRAQYFLQSGGYPPVGVLKHPGMTATIAWDKYQKGYESNLPAAIAMRNVQSAGYLGTDFDPFIIQNPSRASEGIKVPSFRKKMMTSADKMREAYHKVSPLNKSDVYKQECEIEKRTTLLSFGDAADVFDLNNESEAERKKFTGAFGEQCLLACRLIEQGVPSIQLSLGSWDTHQDNFARTATLAKQLDDGIHELVMRLKAHDLYDKTVILIAGEFGRTPRVNENDGRDHFANVWSAMLLGGKIKSQVVGESSPDGMQIDKNGVTVPMLSYTTLKLMGVNPQESFDTSSGRPITSTPGKIPIPGEF